MKKQVLSVSPDGPTFVIATFTFDGEKVTGEYASEHDRAWFEMDGIDFRDRPGLTPTDGKVFFDALDKVFRHSGYVCVRTVEE